MSEINFKRISLPLLWNDSISFDEKGTTILTIKI